MKGGIGILFGNEEISEVVPDIYGEKMTNNITELYAIKRVFEIIQAKNEKETYYKIYSDSEYSILSITKWKPHLRKKQDGKNLKLIKEICDIYDKINYKCELIHVRGHQDSEGNNRADKLARIASGADIKEIGSKRLGVDISYLENYKNNYKKVKY